MNYSFSWAEDADGKIVHVDEVPNGLLCNCHCPHCKEPLIARHGEIYEHGFAHHSNIRKVTLEICYMVTLYKLAEHILLTKKRIHAPSYYGIFKESDLEFTDVRIDSHYEREDKQPDVIAVTSEGKKYLIEFVFRYKVQHKKSIDYKNLNCLEVDLSNQSMETLEAFLLDTCKDRKWLNNEDYFQCIEDTYRNAKKRVKVVNESACSICEIKNHCCAVGGRQTPLTIDNNGEKFRLCKTELYEEEQEKFKKRQLLFEQEREKQSNHKYKETLKNGIQSINLKNVKQESSIDADTTINAAERSCFDCEMNLQWIKDGKAHCGCYSSIGLQRSSIDPSYAKKCLAFKYKER